MEDHELRCCSRYGYDVGCKNLFSATGKHMKYIGYDFNLTAQQSGSMWNWADDYISIFLKNSANEYEGFLSPIDDFSTLYHKGLGRVYERKTIMDRYDMRELIGYIKGIDTVGSTPNISIYTSNKGTVDLSYSIKLLNNPVKNHLNIHYQNPDTKKILQFSVLNTLGQVLTSYVELDQSDKIYTFPIKNLTNGVYFLEIRQDGQLLRTEQFVKQ